MTSYNQQIVLSAERDLKITLIEDIHRYKIDEIFADKSVTSVTSGLFDTFDGDEGKSKFTKRTNSGNVEQQYKIIFFIFCIFCALFQDYLK